MPKSSTQPVLFNKMNRDFRDAYDFVNEYIIELYQLPRKFVEEAEPTMDRYLKEYSIPGTPRKNVLYYPDVVDFVDQLDELTIQTMCLFARHKTHFEKSTAYLKKVAEVDKKKSADTETASQKQLVAELKKLNSDLMDIKTKADDMIGKMEKLELRWGRLKAKMRE